jgi:hypothetical protein
VNIIFNVWPWAFTRAWQRGENQVNNGDIEQDISAKIENDVPTTGFIENGHPTWSFSILPNIICLACVVLRDDDDVVALEC